ncbi:MAG: hypothetical protein PHY47_09090 [Lachnospiraceae bacterium]|nr:hypothetical protein [Lachnospiraceae bacterium]
MNNLIVFTNMFLSYLLVFFVFITVIIVAVMIGKKLRMNKDMKTAALEATNAEQKDHRKE